MLSFTGNPLDRASADAADPDWIAAQQARAEPVPAFLAGQAAPGRRPGRFSCVAALDLAPDQLCVFLGLTGRPAACSPSIWPTAKTPPLIGQGEFRDMRAAAFVLPDAETAIAGQAKALIDWHTAIASAPIAALPRRPPTAAIAATVPAMRHASIFPAPIRW